jgi:hypothetical protein
VSNLQHRARQRLDMVGDSQRWLWDLMMKMRGDGKGWEPHIFVPYYALDNHVADAAADAGTHILRGLQSLNQYRLGLFLSGAMVFGTWRITQGIYRIDPSVYASLIDTPPAKIPASVLTRLPEWAVYVETPGLMLPAGPGFSATPLRGVWARHDQGPGGAAAARLSVMPDIDAGDPLMPPVQTIPLRDASIEDCVQESLDDYLARNGSQQLGMSAAQAAHDIASWLRPVVNLLLYLCTGPEFTHYGQLGEPINPAPIFTRRGLRFFPAQKPQVWDVSVRLGNAIRRAERTEGLIELEGNRGPMRAHIRRAHWHLYWTGSRTGQRRPLVKWLPPIPVNVDDPDNLPAVIRPVK